jgi:hypothetical protein
MAQKFTSTGNFFVKDKSGGYYPATFLADAYGTPIVDSVLANNLSPHKSQDLTLYADRNGTVMPNPGNYLVVPSADYINDMYARGQAYGAMRGVAPLAAAGYLGSTFFPKLGHGDAQYQNKADARHDALTLSADHFIPAFTNAGNFGAGRFSQGANNASNGSFSSNDFLQIFGAANRLESRRDTSAPLGNSPWGYSAITQGYDERPGDKQNSATGLDPNDLTPAFSPSQRRSDLLFDNGTTPFQDYGFPAANGRVTNNATGQIGNWWTPPSVPADGLGPASSGGTNDGSVFSTGAPAFNGYTSNPATTIGPQPPASASPPNSAVPLRFLDRSPVMGPSPERQRLGGVSVDTMPPTTQEPAGLFPRASANPPPALPTAGSGGLLGMLMQPYESQPQADVDTQPAPLPQQTASTPQPAMRRLVAIRNGAPISLPGQAAAFLQDDSTPVRRFPAPIFDFPDRTGTSGSDDREWNSQQPAIPYLMEYIRYLKQADGT